MSNDPLKMLAEDLARFQHDPLGYVMWCFPWGEGQLRGFDGPRKWQKDFLVELGEHTKQRDFDGIHPVEPIQMARSSGHGIGKAHRIDMILDTPQGKTRWGYIRKGDCVFGADGTPVKVISTKRYKHIPMYRVTFDDGSSTEVSSGHLWDVKGRKERRKGEDSWRTLSTLDLINIGVKRPNGATTTKQWEIPVQGPARFRAKKLKIHPYLMGVWLGDGCVGAAQYCKPFDEVKEKVESFGYECKYLKDGQTVAIKGIHPLMTSEVFSKRSPERYIPDEYKYNSVANRKHLLEGLLDTDGEAHASGSIGYSTTSEKLINDVVWLVRSLGGKARIQPTTKRGWYYDENKVKVSCKDCHRVTINISWNPFTLKHRKEKYKPSESRYTKRWIESIEEVGPSDGMCITVDAQNGLYLANDFIITHNSALTSWLIKWILDTRPYSKGVVTANTSDQLKTKTWAELAKWHNMSVTKDMFEIHATKGNMNILSTEAPETWRCDAMTCREENSEAFAGLHSASSTPFYLFDEASAVPEKIFEVAQGGLTDGEPMFFLFGNPTRNTGFFRRVFGRMAHRWKTRQIDSRDVKGTNKELMAKWVEDYGEDSDFVRVRVRGVFPRSAVCQLIPGDLVTNAMTCKLHPSKYDFAPKVLGVDVAWYGDDRNAIWLRQGLGAQLLWQGREIDSIDIAGIVAKFEDEHKTDATFVDAGMGNGVIDQLRRLGREPIAVYFGGKSSSPKYLNKRAQMWGETLEWLKLGPSIPNDPDIFDDLTAPEYHMTLKGEIQLERKEDMKKRGLNSPDLADALVLTFAEPVYKLSRTEEVAGVQSNTVQTEYELF